MLAAWKELHEVNFDPLSECAHHECDNKGAGSTRHNLAAPDDAGKTDWVYYPFLNLCSYEIAYI